MIGWQSVSLWSWTHRKMIPKPGEYSHSVLIPWLLLCSHSPCLHAQTGSPHVHRGFSVHTRCVSMHIQAPLMYTEASLFTLTMYPYILGASLMYTWTSLFTLCFHAHLGFSLSPCTYRLLCISMHIQASLYLHAYTGFSLSPCTSSFLCVSMHI